MNPYLITGPALISFSGGRTSGYMLRQILDAHGGELPSDVHVCFANTGKEREETLRFVHECSVRWGVRIRWLEWRDRPHNQVPPEQRFDEVGYNSASRNGEPFKALIRRKQFLPNAVTRFCTSHLKVDTMKQFMLAQGYPTWINAIGLRADEPTRIMKQVIRNMEGRERWVTYCPMGLAGVVERIVWRFWLGRNADPYHLTHRLPHGFDLGLRRYEGNCDDCFLKGLDVLMQQERERPGTADWWIEAENDVKATATTGAQFITEHSYRDIQRWAQSTPPLADFDSLRPADDCTGGYCAAGSKNEIISDDAIAWLMEHMRKVAANPPPPLTPKMTLEPAIGDMFGEAA